MRDKVSHIPTKNLTIKGGINVDKTQSEIEFGDILILNTRKLHHFKTPPVSSTAIFHRDNFTCAYCGEDFKQNKKKLTIDHIVPRRMKLDNSWKNLITACVRCNNIKDDRLPGHRGAPSLKFQPYTPSEVEYLLMLNPDMTHHQKEFIDSIYQK